jgi:hypothetical protein
MLQFISWTQYFTFLVIVLLIYYSTIIFLFFRNDLGMVFKRRGVGDDMQRMSSLSSLEESNDKLLGDLREIHHATTHRAFPKEELMLTIIQRVKQYRGVNMEMINQFLEEAFPQL